MTTVERIMSRQVVTLLPEQTLRDAIESMRSKRIRHLPVVEGSRLVGIVTDRDVKRATPSLLSGIDRDEFDRVLDDTLVSQIMTRDPTTVTPYMTIKSAVGLLLETRVGALPVVEAGDLVGIVTDTDMLRALYEMLPD